jgi:hypothetical protein
MSMTMSLEAKGRSSSSLSCGRQTRTHACARGREGRVAPHAKTETHVEVWRQTHIHAHVGTYVHIYGHIHTHPHLGRVAGDPAWDVAEVARDQIRLLHLWLDTVCVCVCVCVRACVRACACVWVCWSGLDRSPTTPQPQDAMLTWKPVWRATAASCRSVKVRKVGPSSSGSASSTSGGQASRHSSMSVLVWPCGAGGRTGRA